MRRPSGRWAIRIGLPLLGGGLLIGGAVGLLPDAWRLAVLRVLVVGRTASEPPRAASGPPRPWNRREAAGDPADSLAIPAGVDHLEGVAAKRRVIALLEAGVRRLRAVDAYTATFRRTERIQGTLGPTQMIALKVRHRPFSVYLRWISPHAGQEALYVEGQHDGRIVAHLGGLGRLLAPRTLLAPDDPLLRRSSRHPITESGLLHMNTTFLGYRYGELRQADSVVTLRAAVEDGRPGFRSEHVHRGGRDGSYPYYRAITFIDQAYGFITHYESYDWPTAAPAGDSASTPLLERYRYSDIKLPATLEESAFSPDNPAYAFHRF